MVAAALVLAAALSVMEGVSRLAEPAVVGWQPADRDGVIMTGSASRLWGMAPGVRRNGNADATIGDNGLRAPCPVAPRPIGRQRVLVLGDSSFFGHGIADDETIPVRLEAALKGAGIDADTVNAAIPGYSTEQSRILLDEIGWALEPTLVLVANLWSDNNADGFRDADLLRTVRLQRGNPLTGSALFRLAAGWIDGLRGGGGARVITWTKDSTWPAASTRRVPLQAYAANLDAIARDAASRGVGIAFVAPVNRQRAAGPATEPMRWDPYFDAQREVAAWHGVPVISLVEAMHGVPDAFMDLMHPSAHGAALIATRIQTTLAATGWPAAPLVGRADPFDPSALEDRLASGPTAQAAQFSPQAQLFPDLVDSAPSAIVGDPDHGQDTRRQSLASRAPTTGVVRGGAGPIAIRVKDPSGRIVGSVDLPAPGPFSLPLDRGLGVLDLTATDASGASVSAAIERGTGALDLAFPSL